ncbi:MAG TPA: tripartite tricarboxylate transporter permease [Methanospirillum sp.]|nr:tripartite tricarboxylate transporter permease [Methanospirillum sp.]
MIPLITGSISGIILGMISGLIPGIHSNTVAGILLGLSPFFLAVFGSEGLSAILIATLITHSFLDVLPSTFFGVPDEGTALSVLPAHALALAGKGEEAIRLSALGGLWGVSVGVPLSLAAYALIKPFQGYIDWATAALLVFMMGLVIIMSEAPLWTLIVFISSGMLGLFAFRFEYLSWTTLGNSSILMPLLTGLFGLSVLFTSGQGLIPMQRFSGIGLDQRGILKAAIPGTLAGFLVGWLPGLSTASASAVISTGIRYEIDQRQYLVSAGAATTANALIGIAAFYAIDRTRNGVMVALSSLDPPPFVMILMLSSGVALIAYLLTIRFANSARFFSGIDSRNMNTIIAAVVVVLCAIFTGPFGLFILACSCGIGLVPYLLNIPRVSCMGVVTVPVILISLGIGGF